jgi:hypothetical protein
MIVPLRRRSRGPAGLEAGQGPKQADRPQVLVGDASVLMVRALADANPSVDAIAAA